jgi:hypothetical protein
MSHYAVAVFHRKNQDIDDLLAPYWEELDVDPYIDLTRDEAIAYGKANITDEEQSGKSDEEIWQIVADWYGGKTDDDGNIYSTYNPNSKWDWYEVGGRFSGMLKRKDGGDCDAAIVSDIDFSDDEAVYYRSLRFWDEVVEKRKETHVGDEFFSFYKPEYYLEFYGDRETYAKSMAAWSTRAVVTPDGEWHEPGRMGWWGMSSDTPDSSKDWYAKFRERFIDSADPNWILTIVDCHI